MFLVYLAMFQAVAILFFLKSVMFMKPPPPMFDLV